MRRPTDPSSLEKNSFKGDTFGGAIGFAIAGFANTLPESYSVKTQLVIASPVIAIICGRLWDIYVESYFFRKKIEKYLPELERAIEHAEFAARSAAKSRLASQKHKKDTQEDLERLIRTKTWMLAQSSTVMHISV